MGSVPVQKITPVAKRSPSASVKKRSGAGAMRMVVSGACFFLLAFARL